MNPDVASATVRLAREGVLTREQAALFGRVARGELVSVRPELRAVLYGGVLALLSGVGILVQQNLDRIGPLAIAIGLWLAALGTLTWAARHAPPFSWGREASPHLAFDYILLLGVLLTGVALAYTEVQFTPLGPSWRHHLLVMSVIAAALAVRGDSRMLASLALSSFAAWCGISASPWRRGFWEMGGSEGPLRATALLTGLFFAFLGFLLVRTGRKAHFEPVCAHLGWLLVLAAILSGVGDGGGVGRLFQLGLIVVGSALALLAFRSGRFGLFGMGFVAAYVGLSALVLATLPDPFLAYLWFAATGVVVLIVLLVAHQKVKARS